MIDEQIEQLLKELEMEVRLITSGEKIAQMQMKRDFDGHALAIDREKSYENMKKALVLISNLCHGKASRGWGEIIGCLEDIREKIIVREITAPVSKIDELIEYLTSRIIR